MIEIPVWRQIPPSPAICSIRVFKGLEDAPHSGEGNYLAEFTDPKPILIPKRPHRHTQKRLI